MGHGAAGKTTLSHRIRTGTFAEFDTTEGAVMHTHRVDNSGSSNDTKERKQASKQMNANVGTCSFVCLHVPTLATKRLDSPALPYVASSMAWVLSAHERYVRLRIVPLKMT